MTTNQILKQIQNILDVDDAKIYEIFTLADKNMPKQRVLGYLKEPDDKEFLDCGYAALGTFLDGVIVYKRGEGSSKPKPEKEIKVNNNFILKKLRIAFELKDVDMYAIFNTVDIDITKSELSSLFRKEGHKNYRACPDSIIQLFLEGLEICESELKE
jgi:uncharacterized protein YehS (DUF1456 family)